MIRILLIEDNEFDEDLVLRTLRSANLPFSHQTVVKWQDLARTLEIERFDLVLSDFSLPGFTGYEVLQFIRKNHPGLPVLIVTTSQSEEVAVRCMRAGAEDYILKEHLYRLEPAIRNTLERQRMRREKARAEAELARQSAELRSIFDSIPAEHVILDPQYRVLSFNSLAQKGYQDLLGYHITRGSDWLEIVPHAERAVFTDLFQQVLEGEKNTSKNSSSVTGSMYTSPPCMSTASSGGYVSPRSISTAGNGPSRSWTSTASDTHWRFGAARWACWTGICPTEACISIPI